MADAKITDLTAYTPPIDTDVLPIVDVTAGATKKLTWANLKLNMDLSEDRLRIATVSISSSDILNMFATPKQIIAAPGAGKVLIVEEMVFSFTHGATQYVSGGAVRIQYTGGSTSVFGNNANATVPVGNVTAAADSVAKRGSQEGSVPDSPANTAVELTNGTGAFTTGNGTAKVFVLYRTLTL